EGHEVERRDTKEEVELRLVIRPFGPASCSRSRRQFVFLATFSSWPFAFLRALRGPHFSMIYNVPFVLGTSLLRGSIETACRSALAIALKIASAMWWLLVP